MSRLRGAERVLMGGWLLLVASASHGAVESEVLPTLIIEASPTFEGVAGELRSFERERLAPSMRLTGLRQPGPPIRIVLADEGSALAARVPGWAAGYARGPFDPVVLMPRRVSSYPDRSLASLVQHEVTHVLVARAAGGQVVPRWFNEGLAMVAGHAWSLEDRARVTLDLVAGKGGSLTGVDLAFSRGANEARGAYALSYAFVRDLRLDYGEQATAQILERVRAGAPFEDAFASTTGESLAVVEARFWREWRLWGRWVPLLASSSLFWVPASLLAVLAFRRRRARTAEMMARFEDEESGEPADWP